MSQGRNRSNDGSASRSRSKSRSQSRSGGGGGGGGDGSRSRSRSGSLVSTASYVFFCFLIFRKLFSIIFSGRAARGRDWDGESGYRLHVSPLNPRTKRQDIEKIFSKFGTINEVFRLFYFILFNRNSFLGLDGNESTLFRFCEL